MLIVGVWGGTEDEIVGDVGGCTGGKTVVGGLIVWGWIGFWLIFGAWGGVLGWGGVAVELVPSPIYWELSKAKIGKNIKGKKK